MKTQYTVTVAVLAGMAIGAVAVQGLHAQAKPPLYYIAEIDVTNADAYLKEYAPKAQATIEARSSVHSPLRACRSSPSNQRIQTI
jgi:hypothetical protein